ncbi:MAG TPA: Gfo/Idh/MocA family oxidoreductase [Anaerolineales bacterium]|nr:Gfo/Idh/MocA family oxidoreductase [Anaerolineales bacterium]
MKTFRVGIIGCGTIFVSSHAYPLHRLPNVEVRAVCDVKPQAVDFAKQLFKCDGYSDYHELLQRGDLDVVHILTPHYLHAPMAVAAAQAGLHVLSEKPMSITIDEARAMLEAAKRNSVTLGVISQNRYNAASIAIKEAMSNGSLGKVLGQRITMPGTKPMEYFRNSDWRGTWDKEGGSLIIDQAVHIIDLARWFIDEPVASVVATIANRDHPEIETEDTAEGLIVYRSGVRSVFMATNNFTYNAPSIVETQCERGIALLEFDRAVITYANGQERIVVNDPTVTLDEKDFKDFIGRDIGALAFQTLKQWGVVFAPILWKATKGTWGVTHYKQIENFYASLEAGKPPDVPGDEAIKTQEIISAIYQSAREGRTVQF